MDATERARLRALCETIPAGAVTPCCERAGEDGHHSSWSLGAMAYGAAIRAWVHGPLDLLALARTAIPALLDDSERLDAVTRERDEARAGRALAEELACAIGVERDILRRERDEALAEMERLRRRIGALEHAVMMADSLDGEVSFDDIECPFCDEAWRDDGHALACPRHMGDVIRRERAAGDGAP